jgi:hypothetical protein
MCVGGRIFIEVSSERNTWYQNVCTFAGGFIFIEASPRLECDRAVLISPTLAPAASRCLHFYYYMYGQGTGALRVLLHGTRVWEVKHDQGQAWQLAEVPVNYTAGSYEVFRRRSGKLPPNNYM